MLPHARARTQKHETSADVVRALLVAGARPGVAAEKGWTALMAAAAEGHGKIVRELLLMLAFQEEDGAARAGRAGGGGGEGVVDARNNKGCTALIMAARNGYAGMQMWLGGSAVICFFLFCFSVMHVVGGARACVR